MIRNSLYESWVIFIEVDTFKKYWRRNHYDKYSKYVKVSEYELRQDYKFKCAEEGFSRGRKNLVPVARIEFLGNTTLPYIEINESIICTIWLIANDYKIILFKVVNVILDFPLYKEVYFFK